MQGLKPGIEMCDGGADVLWPQTMGCCSIYKTGQGVQGSIRVGCGRSCRDMHGRSGFRVGKHWTKEV